MTSHIDRKHDPLRRKLLATIAALPLTAAAQTAGQSSLQSAASPTLVAYFSRSGNTRVVAGLIQRALSADLFEIRPATPYPEHYLATVAQAKRESDSGFEPPLAAIDERLAQYSTVYLGFPIWGTTVPPVIRSFLRAHALSGKTLIPFVTHGGYGVGNSRSVLASHARGAKLQAGFVMKADQERDTMESVNKWLAGGSKR
jgi:flavodoxin